MQSSHNNIFLNRKVNIVLYHWIEFDVIQIDENQIIKCESELILKFTKKKVNLNVVESLKLQIHLTFVALEGNYLLNYFKTKLNLFYKKILKKIKLFFKFISIEKKREKNLISK